MDTWEPRVDVEMVQVLRELGEYEHLDYKREIDFSNKKAALEFVKDVVAMANSHPGGHIVVGVESNGNWPKEPIFIDPAQFDSAKLLDKVSGYLEAPIEIRSQVHRLKGRDVAIIAVQAKEPYFPIPISKQGSYQSENGKTKTVLHEGEIYTREGSKNVRVRYAHWAALLDRHDEVVRENTRKDIDAILSMLASSKGLTTKSGVSIPLDVNLPLSALAAALSANFRERDLGAINLFLAQLKNSAASEEKIVPITLIAVQALVYQQDELFSSVIDSLHELYVSSQDAQNKLDVIVSIYIIGASVVRFKRWELLRGLVLGRAEDKRNYHSWIREGQVKASRSNLFPAKATGLMINLAHGLCANVPELRTDVKGELPTDEIPLDDVLLNSLCWFDFAQVIIQNVDRTQSFDTGYPACGAFNEERVDPFMFSFISNEKMRHEITGIEDEKQIQDAVESAYQLAKRAADAVGNWWPTPHYRIEEYLGIDLVW